MCCFATRHRMPGETAGVVDEDVIAVPLRFSTRWIQAAAAARSVRATISVTILALVRALSASARISHPNTVAPKAANRVAMARPKPIAAPLTATI